MCYDNMWSGQCLLVLQVNLLLLFQCEGVVSSSETLMTTYHATCSRISQYHHLNRHHFDMYMSYHWRESFNTDRSPSDS